MKRKKSKKIKKSDKQDKFISLSYELTYEPIYNSFFKKLPQKVKHEIEDIFYMTNTVPEKAIPKIKEKIKEYPNAPFLYNYLGKAYSLLKDYKNAEKVILENYQRHPNYLFARINYAQICLEKGELDKIPEIFNNTYDLKMMYPSRNKFNITEYVSFAGIVGEYFARKGEVETATLFLKVLKDIAPKHYLTKRLKMILNPNLLDRFIINVEKKLED